LFAHKNNLIFPYVELQEYSSDAYIEIGQNIEYMQYFFTMETTFNLTKLCNDYTACLVTPSVAQCAYKEGKNIVLFEQDNRFRENKGLKYIKYDLYKGLTKLLYNRYLNKFDTVICDPPFNIRLDILSRDIAELLKHDKSSIAYIVFPNKDKANLINAMKIIGMHLIEEPNKVSIEYAKPPKIVRVQGKDAIQLFKFSFLTHDQQIVDFKELP
jgi:16S rRNA G966 N2-methylase RsmD